MRPRRSRLPAASLVVALASLAGCFAPVNYVVLGPEAGHEAAPADAPVDAVAPPADEGPDALVSEDAPVPGPEAGSDAARDPGAEPLVDAAREPGPEAGPDAGRDAGPEPTLDAAREAGPEPTLDAAREPGPEAGPDAGRDATIDTGCPPPAILGPADLPADQFLPALTAGLHHAVDGDTAAFYLGSASTYTTVRFLWVNTEEIHGDAATVFGDQAATFTGDALRAARVIQVVPQRSAVGATTPMLDVYGRTLALVFVDGELLQTRLVRGGWTPYYTDFGCAPEPVHTTLLRAEAEAFAYQRGVWTAGHTPDYRTVLLNWLGRQPWCRPNPYYANMPYCR